MIPRSMIQRATRATATLVLGSASAFSQGKVWVVDDNPGPGVDFGTIQAAIDAAASGDTVLVHPGSYLAFLISAKSLDVIADSPTPIALVPNDGIKVKNLAASQAVVLRGFRYDASFVETPLELTQNQGRVWVEDCSLHGRYQDAAVFVTNCAAVSFLRCTVEAKENDNRGLKADHANLHVFDSSFKGSASASQMTGAEAARLDSSFLFASGSFFQGGMGGPAEFSPILGLWLTSGDGGAGLKLVDSAAWLLGNTMLGGAPGVGGGPFFLCCKGVPGQPVHSIGSSSAVALPGAARTLSIGSPVREGQNIVLKYGGQPGDFLFLLVSGDQSPLFVQQCNGTVLPSLASFQVVFQGVLPASGALDVAIPAHDLGAGVQLVHRFAQAILIPADGSMHVSSGSAVTILDASF